MIKCSRWMGIAVLAAASGVVATAQADAVRAGFNTTSFGSSDDGVLGVNLGLSNIQFGAFVGGSAYLHNNGMLAFDGADHGFFQSSGFNNGTYANTPAIAAFWNDVDTSGGGSGTLSYGNGSVGGRSAWGATWNNVDSWAAGGRPGNTFQLVIIDRSDTGAGNFDFEMNYREINWDVGNDGGTGTFVGYDNHAGSSNVFSGSGSGGTFVDSNGATGLVHGSHWNAVAGRYLYQVRDGQVVLVPLPTAAYTGLASLAGLAGLGVIRRRRLARA